MFTICDEAPSLGCSVTSTPSSAQRRSSSPSSTPSTLTSSSSSRPHTISLTSSRRHTRNSFPLLPLSLLSLLTAFLLPSPAHAALRNATIDDYYGDSLTGLRPTYTPRTSWATEACVTCRVRPATAQAFNLTYIGATYTGGTAEPVTFEFQFTGAYLTFSPPYCYID